MNYKLTQTNRGLALSPAIWLALLILAGWTAAPVLAAGGEEASMEWGYMAMNLLGGLAIFLFGMEQMAESLKSIAGDRMKKVLAKLTASRFMGALTGAFVTAIIQSSSVTTVLVVGFITAGLMSMSQSIGIIMGANIGTTITAQIIAFKITKAALLMVAIGFSMQFFSKEEKIRQYGTMLMGLGLVFFGMSVMSDAMTPLRTYQPFLDLMGKMDNPLVGIMISAAFTGLVQSSSATTGIIIVMASQGLISLPAGIALAFGANIGTCVTALLAAIGKPREALRASLVHVLFNVAGVLLWVSFIPYLAEFVTMLSPTYPQQTGIDRLAAETPRQIANAHTVFNVANTILLIGFASQFARLVEWLVPDRPIQDLVIAKPKYLDKELLDTPSLALERVRLEISHMGSRVKEMVDRIMPAIISGNRIALKEVAKIDDEVDILHGYIVTYLGQISSRSLSEEQTGQLINLMAATNDLENIGDIIETDMVHLGNQKIDREVNISEATQEVLKKLHHVVATTSELALEAITEDDQHAAQEVIAMKSDIRRLTDAATIYQMGRLVAEEPKRLEAYTLEIDIIEKLKRIYYFSKHMAKTVMPVEAMEGAV